MYRTLLCWRYLRTRWIALASVVSVTLGVATLIVVNAVMAGFTTQMRDRIHAILADVKVHSRLMEGFPDPEKKMAEMQAALGDKIAVMTPTVETVGMLSFNYAGKSVTQHVQVIGIDPAGRARVGDFAQHLLAPENQERPSFNLGVNARQRRVQKHLRRTAESKLQQEAKLGEPSDEGATSNAPVPNAPSDAAPPSGDAGGAQANLPTELAPEHPESADHDEAADPFAGGPDGAETAPADPTAPADMRIILGYLLASYRHDGPDGQPTDYYMVKPGDDVQLTIPNAGQPPKPVYTNATTVDFFKSNMSEYDAQFVFVPIEELQYLRGMVDEATGTRYVSAIQIKLKDYADAPYVVEKLKEIFPAAHFAVSTWEEQQGPLLAAVDIESAILNVLLFLIIAVAGFGILAIFYMIVVEKTRDIGILKALGASSRGVMGIFLSYGLSLGIVGSGIGMVLGLIFVRYINEIEALVSRITGHKVFDERIYYFSSIPTIVHPVTVTWIVLGALAIAVAASILPSRRAARLHPVEALRYDQ